MDKKEFRKIYLPKRSQLKNKETDKAIIDRFIKLSDFKDVSSIFITKSIGSEIKTDEIIKKAFEQNKRVFIPKIDKNINMIIPTEIKSEKIKLIKGEFDIPEPENFPDFIEQPELVVVPGLAFSETGYRIGYGGGFYDRYLEEYKPNTTALVYDDLVFKNIPLEDFDVPVNQIITEKRIINLK